MDHKLMKDRLSGYCDGELSKAEADEVSAHLKLCAECAAFYENWKAISGRLFRQETPKASEAFVRGVMDRIASAEAGPRLVRVRPRFPVQWLAPALGMAAMLFLALLPSPEILSAEALVMNGPMDRASQWVFLNGAPQNDDLLGFVLEER